MAELVAEDNGVKIVEVPVYRAWHVALGFCSILVLLVGFLYVNAWREEKFIKEVKAEMQKIRDDVKVKHFEIDRDWLQLRMRQADLEQIVTSMGGNFVRARLNGKSKSSEKKKTGKVQKGHNRLRGDSVGKPDKKSKKGRSPSRKKGVVVKAVE